MQKLETVAIVFKGKKAWLNKKDYDPKVHKLWVEPVVQKEPAKKAEKVDK